jgi:hypothetical protein
MIPNMLKKLIAILYFTLLSSNLSSREFVIFSQPKTGTHLLRPILEHLTDHPSETYWAPKIKCAKSYLYDKTKMAESLASPEMLQLYWLNLPIPKHVVISLLNDMLAQGNFLVTHAPYSIEMENLLKKRETLVFFLIRDPRDWVVSVIKHPVVSGADFYGRPIGDCRFEFLTNDQKIHAILGGSQQYYSAREIFNKFLPWKNSPIACVVRYEALLGPRGGFSEHAQLAELRKIATALQIDMSDKDLLKAFQASFGIGSVFQTGQAGTWKNYFKEEHKKAFKKQLGSILIELGYEKDEHW